MIRDIVKQSVPIGSERTFDWRGFSRQGALIFLLSRTKERSIIARCFHRNQIEPPIVWQNKRGAPAAHCEGSDLIPDFLYNGLSHVPSVSSRGSRGRVQNNYIVAR